MSAAYDVGVVGAGIVGLAHAYHLARRGLRVLVFERHRRAQGASVRNFGMIWPIGQPNGQLHQLALRSRDRWLEVLEAAGLPYQSDGSLHVVYGEDEAAVAREFAELAPGLGYSCSWLSAGQVLARSQAVQPEGLIGALWSETELTVDPRVTLARLPRYLEEAFGVAWIECCGLLQVANPFGPPPSVNETPSPLGQSLRIAGVTAQRVLYLIEKTHRIARTLPVIEAQYGVSEWQFRIESQGSLSGLPHQLEALEVSHPEWSGAAREHADKLIADYRATVAHYESDPSTGEGKKELLQRARG